MGTEQGAGDKIALERYKIIMNFRGFRRKLP
jgi:hypothetical protein